MIFILDKCRLLFSIAQTLILSILAPASSRAVQALLKMRAIKLANNKQLCYFKPPKYSHHFWKSLQAIAPFQFHSEGTHLFLYYLDKTVHALS